MNRVLFLYASNTSEAVYFAKERNKVSGVDSRPLYKKNGLINKIILILGYYIFPRLLYLIYEDWKKQVNDYDIIILPSRRASKYAVMYLNKKMGKKVIVWYWNIVTKKELEPEFCRKNGCEVWSFDINDCKKYNMKYGDTYYFFNDYNNCNSDVNGIFYVGVDKKGRREQLTSLLTYCNNNDVMLDYYLVSNSSLQRDDSLKYSSYVSYEKVIEIMKLRVAILDLTQENQRGLTLRPLEALALKKKLITNNTNIVDSKAYDKNNTFIIRDNDYTGLIDFLSSPYVPNDSNIFEFYKFENWLYRICNGIEAY